MEEIDLCRLLICTFGVLLATVSIAGGKHLCGINQLVVIKHDGSTGCQDCLVCPPGKGFSHICGSSNAVISEDEVKNLKCVDCVPGKTFSASYGTTQCEQCGTCFQDQVVEKICTVISPVKCGNTCYSKEKYLSQYSGKCELCSTCCKSLDHTVMDECVKKGNPASQSCSIDHHCNPTTTQPPPPTTGQATTPTEGTPGGTSNQADANKDDSSGNSFTSSAKKPMAAIIAFLILALLIVGLVLWWRLCAKEQFPRCCLDPERGHQRVAFNSRTERVTFTGQSSNVSRVSRVERRRVVSPVTTTPNHTVPAHSTVQQAPNLTDPNSNPIRVPCTESRKNEVSPVTTTPHQTVPAHDTPQQTLNFTARNSNPIDSQMKLSDFAEQQFHEYENVCEALDTKIQGCGNYEHVAKHYGANFYKINGCFKNNTSHPSKAMFEWLMCQVPDLTVGEFVQVLQMEGISRNDVAAMFRISNH